MALTNIPDNGLWGDISSTLNNNFGGVLEDTPLDTAYAFSGSVAVPVYDSTGVLRLKWTTDTLDPGVGEVSADSADFASITELKITKYTDVGADLSYVLEKLKTDNTLYISVDQDSSSFVGVTILGDAVDNTTYYSFPVFVETVGATATEGEFLLFTVTPTDNVLDGDMESSVYDPTDQHADVFSMEFMIESATEKVMTADERATISGTRSDLDSLGAAFGTLSQDVEDLEDVVTLQGDQVVLNTAQLVDNTADIADNTADIDGQGAALDILGPKVFANEAAIATNITDIAANSIIVAANATALDETGIVKVGYTGLVLVGFTANVMYTFDVLAATATVNPVTIYPASTVTQGTSAIFNPTAVSGNPAGIVGKFIENPVNLQANVWRFHVTFSNKATNNNLGVTFALRNPDTGFENDYLLTLPSGTTSGSCTFEMSTISDAGSTAVGSGYVLEAMSTTSDDNLSFEINHITRFNNATQSYV